MPLLKSWCACRRIDRANILLRTMYFLLRCTREIRPRGTRYNNVCSECTLRFFSILVYLILRKYCSHDRYVVRKCRNWNVSPSLSDYSRKAELPRQSQKKMSRVGSFLTKSISLPSRLQTSKTQ